MFSARLFSNVDSYFTHSQKSTFKPKASSLMRKKFAVSSIETKHLVTPMAQTRTT